MNKAPGKHCFRRQLRSLIELPDFVSVTRVEQLGGGDREGCAHVVDVALQHGERMVVARGIDCLRQIDDHWAVDVHEDVVVRKVAVDESGAEHAYDLRHHESVPAARLFRCHRYFVKAGRGVALFVDDQLHQQHASMRVPRPGHTHTGMSEPIERGDFGILPRGFPHVAAVTAALTHGAGIAAAAGLAALLVLGEFVETAALGFLVDFRAADLAAARNHVNRSFFTALELAQDLVDLAFCNQRLQSLGNFHRAGPLRCGPPIPAGKYTISVSSSRLWLRASP